MLQAVEQGPATGGCAEVLGQIQRRGQLAVAQRLLNQANPLDNKHPLVVALFAGAHQRADAFDMSISGAGDEVAHNTALD
jgi:hypothetical protein